MCDEEHKSGPNICGLRLNGSECWLRHPISGEDTMTRLALKYDTSIGLICRANRMHGQDVLQTRRHIWVPIPPSQCQMFHGREQPTQQSLLFGHSHSHSLPPHFYRQSAPNPNDLAEESDPLLITTNIMWSGELLAETEV